MPHQTPLIATIAVGLGLALMFGVLAQRFKLPPIVGYLAAGIVVGPFTPGFVADQKLAVELAEIGVILLMFGVGLHFSLKDLASVRAIAIPGAIGQIAVATLMGMGLAFALGWPPGAGLLFGLSLSVASTVVLLRALQERNQIETEKGRIAVGWLIVEDLAMVVALVLIPPLAGVLGGEAPAHVGDRGLVGALAPDSLWATLGLTAIKVLIFVALMLVVGRRLIPAALHYVAHTGSRELFRLAVLAIALGVAFGSAKLFGVSFALGAFFAGMVLAESELSTQAAKETLPLRDAFAVLFFVSVGMLFDPTTLVRQPLAVLSVCLIILLGKSIAAYFIVRAFGRSNETALTISASLAQIGEFSFILIVLAVDLAIAPAVARDLVVAGAILSIMFNPLVFAAADRLAARREVREAPARPDQKDAVAATRVEQEHTPTSLKNHAILIGHGRVGAHIGGALSAHGLPYLVVEEEAATVDALRARGVEAFVGRAGEAATLGLLNLNEARCLVLAIPDPFESGHIAEAAKAANPAVRVVARAHSAEGVAYLRKLGCDVVLMGEEELARSMFGAIIMAPAQETYGSPNDSTAEASRTLSPVKS